MVLLKARLGLPMLQLVLLTLARRSRGLQPARTSGRGACRWFGGGPVVGIIGHHRPRSAIRAGRVAPPPEFSIIEDDDDGGGGGDDNEDTRANYGGDKGSGSGREPLFGSDSQPPPDFSIDFDDDGEVTVRPAAPARGPRAGRRDGPRRSAAVAAAPPPNVAASASWMARNDAFRGAAAGGRTFREDFRGTRLFVQNLPPGASWQDLKDHFKRAGEVVFASISHGLDERTGEPKRCGIVQYETTSMAQLAIETMGQYPLDGYTLSVRQDLQEEKEGARLGSAGGKRGPTPPTKWKCADDGVSQLTENQLTAVRMLIKERDYARRRKDYDLSDEIREDLKNRYGVQIDDRLKMFWTSADGRSVPSTIQDIKGEGRWGALKPWRMIPTTPENDACVNPDLVSGLLQQRDIARREKDFATADRLLAEARDSPDGDLTIRIHDESRTWRIWTEERPSFAEPKAKRKAPAEQCIDLVEEFAPERLQEIRMLLEKFPGREYNILKKLKKQFNV